MMVGGGTNPHGAGGDTGPPPAPAVMGVDHLGVKIFLEPSANPNIFLSHGSSLLRFAFDNADADIAELLVRYGARREGFSAGEIDVLNVLCAPRVRVLRVCCRPIAFDALSAAALHAQ